MATAIDWAISSVTGAGRAHNQDRCATDGRLFALADGIGGHSSGHVAATIAIQTLFRHPVTDPESFADAFAGANRAVVSAAREHPAFADMGTTLTAALVTDFGISVVSVGDSRCYLQIGDELTTVTEDDNLARALEIPPQDPRFARSASVLTRSLGRDWDIEIDVRTVAVDTTAVLVLTSDGIHDYVTADDLRVPDGPLDAYTTALSEIARDGRSLDDRSVVAALLTRGAVA